MSRQLPVEFDVIRKQLFVENLTLGLSPVDAAQAAGFEVNLKRIATKMLEDEDVQEMIEGYKRKLEQMYDVSRDKVLRDLVDAKEMARTQGDPKSMVIALKEVSEVQGYHAPKHVSVEQTHTVQSNVKHRLRQVTEAELIELAGETEFTSVELIPHDQ